MEGRGTSPLYVVEVDYMLQLPIMQTCYSRVHRWSQPHGARPKAVKWAGEKHRLLRCRLHDAGYITEGDIARRINEQFNEEIVKCLTDIDTFLYAYVTRTPNEGFLDHVTLP